MLRGTAARVQTSARASMVVERVEPRILHSADLASVFTDGSALSAQVEHRVIEPAAAPDPAPAAEKEQARTQELVFVDTAAPDYQALLADLLGQAGSGRSMEIVLIDHDAEGLRLISDTLAGRSGIDAIHIISHGSDGTVQIGRDLLDLHSLGEYEAELQRWSAAFAPGADLLIYGCDVAATADGRALVDALSRATGADVAASENATGASSLGGDWVLEYSSGAIQARMAISDYMQSKWSGLLNVATLQASQDTYIVSSTGNNYGANTLLTANSGGAGNERVLLMFDLSALSSGATINSATLQLQATSVSAPLNVAAYTILQSWTEGAGTGTPGVASWTQRVAGTNWTSAGGDFNSTAVATSAISAAGQQSWDLTALVRNWATGAQVNNGVMLLSPDGGTKIVTYDSREGTNAPQLVINYTNTAPGLSGANDLTTIAEDPATNPGTLVSALISGKTSDLDPGAQSGIAVIGVDNTNGTWQYSVNGGGSWTAFGIPTAASARLLASDAATTYVRFVPNADYHGSVSNGLTFRAWDQTDLSLNGSVADTNAVVHTLVDRFDTVSYSNTDGTAYWSSGWVDSDGNPSGGSVTVSGGKLNLATLVGTDSIYRQANLSGASAATLSFSYTNSLGLLGTVSLQASSNGGGSYTTLATFSNVSNTGSNTFTTDISGYIASNTRIQFVMNGVLLGGNLQIDDVQISYLTPPGGSTPFSAATASSSITVSSVNDAPVGTSVTKSTPEDTAYVFSMTDFGLTDPKDSPANAPLAVKITTFTGSGALTLSGMAVSDGQFISASDIGLNKLVFTPVANTNGAGYASFSFQVQDDGGVANGGVDLDQTARTFTMNVAASNDPPAGAPTITGTVTEDQTLSADTSGISDADGLGAFNYQWLRNGVAIGSATASTYTLGDADVGAQISVAVSYTDAQGTSEGPLTSAQTAAVANLNDTPAGVPTISGTVTEDQTLSADTSGISDADGLGAFNYQWLRNGVAIGSATASTYTLGDADVGAQISVAVSYTDAQGTSEGPLTSAQTAAVANLNDSPAGVPTISGTVTEDQTLSADTSGISDADGLGAFNYQWLRNGVAIGSATASTYTLGDADVGAQISVAVSYTDAQGTSEGPLTSAQTAAVANLNDSPAGVPTISGTVTEDQTLSADTSGISDADGLGAFNYQWLRNGVAIGSATASTYTLGDADVGAQISVAVSYTDAQGTSEGPLTSAQTAAVANVNDTPAGVPTISGTVTEDQTLSADTSGISDADGLGAFSYQWLRNGVAIGSATASTYTLGDADVGAQISVAVSYTDAQGTSEGPLTSAQTAAVANLNDSPAGVPTISGTVMTGQALTADASAVTDADGLGAFNYQWLRGGIAIGGATASTYTLGNADVGAQISVQVTYIDALGFSEGPLDSVQTPPVINLPAVLPITPPVVSVPPSTDPGDDGDALNPVSEATAEPAPSVTPVPLPSSEPAISLPADSTPDTQDAPAASATPETDQTSTSGRGSNTAFGGRELRLQSLAEQPEITLANFALTSRDAQYATDIAIAALHSSALINELDGLRDSLQEEARIEANTVALTTAATLGLSVGYVFWLLRGGVLLSTVLSSMPAWRLVDPLPILGRLEEDDEGTTDGDESLESLVARQNRTARQEEPEPA